MIPIDCEGEFKVKNARDVLPLLSPRVYEKFGDQTLLLKISKTIPVDDDRCEMIFTTLKSKEALWRLKLIV